MNNRNLANNDLSVPEIEQIVDEHLNGDNESTLGIDLNDINSEIATILIQIRKLSLPNITVLPDDVSEIFYQDAEFKTLKLDGLTEATPELLDKLVETDANLSLNGLRRLDFESATVLAGSTRTISLLGMEILTSGVVEELLETEGTILLNGKFVFKTDTVVEKLLDNATNVERDGIVYTISKRGAN